MQKSIKKYGVLWRLIIILCMVATYCPPATNTDTVTSHDAASQQWRTAHVRESQYCLQLVRCNDQQCCTPWRSPLQNLLPCRFLPNPVSAKHSGQRIVTSSADNAPTFLPLFVNLQLNSVVQKEKMEGFIIPPYDLYCPSVQPHLAKRCCSVCGIYHASIKSAMNHKKECHRRPAGPTQIPIEQVERRRPVRIAARRQREMMVILRDHLNGETAEWLDVDDIQLDDNNGEHERTARDDVVPLVGSIPEWTSTAWEDV